MRPPDGPPAGPTESDWTQLLQGELDSWQPSRLPARFRSRRQGLHHGNVWRPLQLAAAAAFLMLVAAAALAGGPRGLTTALVRLVSGHSVARPAPQPHSSTSGGTPTVTTPPVGAPAGATQDTAIPTSETVPAPGRTSGGGAPATQTGTPTPNTGSGAQGGLPAGLPTLPPLPLPSLPPITQVPLPGAHATATPSSHH